MPQAAEVCQSTSDVANRTDAVFLMDKLDKATDLQCHPLPGGDILVRFRTADGQIAIAVPPKIVGELLATLLEAVRTSSSPDLNQWIQYLALKDFVPTLVHGLPAIRYETESGVELTTSLPPETVARAIEVWGKADPALQNPPSRAH